MKKSIFVIGLALLLCGRASAQGFDTGGLVVDKSTINAFDIFNTSHTQFNMGTARSAAMAGAMTSLGADASSMVINPAGMGMYKSNEITITPMMSFSRSTTNASPFEGNGKNRFSIGNLGLVAKIRESSTGIVAINMGVAYTRLADYNYKMSFANYGNAGASSIADIFAGQLAASGMTSEQLKNNYNNNGEFRWNTIDPTYWGATLGYKTGLVGDSSGFWGRDMIGNNAAVDNFTTVESKGSAGEWTWSLGMNINNKFYVGASLSASRIRRKQHTYYGEGYHYSSEPALNYRMDYFNYDQMSEIKGEGINFKIGGVYRPIEQLRIGLAFHTPTIYDVVYRYRSGMTSGVKALNNVDDYLLNKDGYIDPPFSETTITLIDDGDYRWTYTTPTKLLAGISYTFARQLVLSVDYQRDWYNGMRIKKSPYGKGLYKDYIKDTFRASNTVRVGAEWRVIPQLALRAGYGHWSGALNNENEIYSTPVIYRTDYVGAGIGVAITRLFSIDFTYQYCKDKYTPYKLFYGYDDVVDFASPTFNTDIARHSAMITLGFHF